MDPTTASPERTTSRGRGYLACAAAGALWGTGFFFGKIALREVSVGHMVLYRFLFATLAVIPLAVRPSGKWSKRDWAILTVSAFFGVPLQFLVQFEGLSLTTLAHAALMIGTMPVILAAAAAVFLHERLDRIGWASLVASTAGACLIALGRSGGNSTLLGDALVVLSLVIALVWILGNRSLLDRHSALAVTARSVIVGTAMLAVWVTLQYGPPPVHGVSLKVWLSLAASGVLCTAATTVLWNWGMTQVPASEAGIFLNMEPVIGSVLGVAVFHEQLGPTAWLGGAMIVGSAVVLSTKSNGGAEAAVLAPVE
jgi:drug/metabolite transporter (DMT)-like permease